MKSFSKIGDMHPVLCMERTLDQEKQKKNIGVLEENNMTAKEDDQKFAIAVTNFSLDSACDDEIELKHTKDNAEIDGMTGEITGKKLKIKCIPA